jgi:hypothetical protein
MQIIDLLRKWGGTLTGLAELLESAERVPELERRIGVLEARGNTPAQPAPEPEDEEGANTGGGEAEPVDLSTITHDPATWPTREAKTAKTVPTRKEYDVDEVDHHIVKVVAEHEGSELLECRDSVASIRRLSHMQLAGILSHHSRATNGGGEGTPSYTHNPETWPRREAKAEYEDGHPPRGQTDYQPDEVDLAIALAVRRHAPDQWPTLRMEICKARQLTPQQTAWLGAKITREGLLDAA